MIRDESLINECHRQHAVNKSGHRGLVAKLTVFTPKAWERDVAPW